MVLAEDTTVLYTTPNVSSYAQTTQAELIGSRLLTHAHPDDHAKFLRHLGRQRSGLPAVDTGFNEMPAKGTRAFFHFRLRTPESGEYEHFNIMGHYRRVTGGAYSEAAAASAKAVAKKKHNAYAFLGVVRPVQDRPMTELSLMEAIQDQYITRHLTDGKIIFVDQRYVN